LHPSLASPHRARLCHSLRLHIDGWQEKKPAAAPDDDDSDDDSDDDVPLAQRKDAAAPAKPAAAPKVEEDEDDDSDDDDAPLSSMMGSGTAAAPAKAASPKKRKLESVKEERPQLAKRNLSSGAHELAVEDGEAGSDSAVRAWWEDEEEEDENIKWRTMEHNGVLFPPPYVAHGKKLLYGPDKTPITMNAEGEEVATFYAAMLETEYVKNDDFNKNFFRDFKKVLNASLKPGDPPHTVQDLKQCDFSLIAAWVSSERERKKAIPAEEKKRDKAIKDEHEKPYKFCTINKNKEKLGNMMVEPPNLFRGRGEHPKKGTLKLRVMSEQITVNCGYEAKVPICPMPGHEWGEVIHNNEVTWLAYWVENVLNMSKYVRLANESSFKGKSDLKKYETARKLKDHIGRIRDWYEKKLLSKNVGEQQMAVAVFLIDRLALRVGGEKNTDEEADTVGCCSLRVEHVSLQEPDELTLDFLGKDSIRNHQTIKMSQWGEVGQKVWSRVGKLIKGKAPTEMIFDQVSPSMVNEQMHTFMPKLTAKVFRTYNASIVLDNELAKMDPSLDLEQRKVFYTDANTRVAVLCNHQRAKAANHDEKMAIAKEKVEIDKQALDHLKKALPKAKKSKESVEVKEFVKNKPKVDKDGKKIPIPPADVNKGKWEKRSKSLDQIKKTIVRIEERIKKQEADSEMKVRAPCRAISCRAVTCPHSTIR
jgi:DNA topoisomerase-1